MRSPLATTREWLPLATTREKSRKQHLPPSWEAMAPAPSPPPRRKGESLGPESFYFSSSSTGQNLSLPVGSPPPSSSRQPWGFLWAQESQCGPACSLWTTPCAPICSRCSGHTLLFYTVFFRNQIPHLCKHQTLATSPFPFHSELFCDPHKLQWSGGFAEEIKQGSQSHEQL